MLVQKYLHKTLKLQKLEGEAKVEATPADQNERHFISWCGPLSGNEALHYKILYFYLYIFIEYSTHICINEGLV